MTTDPHTTQPAQPQCCGYPMRHTGPSVWLLPGELHVERVYHCPVCGRYDHIPVTDPHEADLLFAAVAL